MPTFRRDTASAFLQRAAAGPVSLLSTALDQAAGEAGSSGRGSTSSDTHSGGGGGGAAPGLVSGRLLLLLSCDAHAARTAYLHALVARHACGAADLRERISQAARGRSPSSSSDVAATACCIHWVVAPGASSFALHGFLRVLETTLWDTVGGLVRGQGGGAVALWMLLRDGGSEAARAAGSPEQGAKSRVVAQVFQELLLGALACVNVSHPATAAELVRVVASGPPPQRASPAKAAASAVPLLVVDGVGARECHLQSLERQVGCEVPLRWALEEAVLGRHVAAIVAEGSAIAPSALYAGHGQPVIDYSAGSCRARDLSTIVQALSSPWALTVPPDHLAATRHGDTAPAAATKSDREAFAALLVARQRTMMATPSSPPVKVEGVRESAAAASPPPTSLLFASSTSALVGTCVAVIMHPQQQQQQQQQHPSRVAPGESGAGKRYTLVCASLSPGLSSASGGGGRPRQSEVTGVLSATTSMSVAVDGSSVQLAA